MEEIRGNWGKVYQSSQDTRNLVGTRGRGAASGSRAHNVLPKPPDTRCIVHPKQMDSRSETSSMRTGPGKTRGLNQPVIVAARARLA